MQLYKANSQWRFRPKDQRFNNIDELYDSVLKRYSVSYHGDMDFASIVAANSKTIYPDGEEQNDVVIIPSDEKTPKNHIAFSNWGFSQLCSEIGCPPSYMRRIPTNLSVQCINHGIVEIAKTDNPIRKLLVTGTGDDAMLRSVTSKTYGRIWDADVVRAVRDIVSCNPSWHNPPAMDGNAGLYASDRDVFMFMVDEDHKVQVQDRYLSRGFFVWNSEVGKSTLGIMTFLYDYVCGNHIIWGAMDVRTLKIRHTKTAPIVGLQQIIPRVEEYLNSSAEKEEKILKAATEKAIANDNIGVISFLKKHGFSGTQSEDIVEYTETKYGDSANLWNLVSGTTAWANKNDHIDVRLDVEQKAGSMLRAINV